MRKSTLFVCVAMLALSFTSCKKKYSCTCTYPDVVNGGNKTEVVGTYEGASKSVAQDRCDDLKADLLAVYGTASCHL